MLIEADINNKKIAWLRVLFASVLMLVCFLTAMALMLFYRMSFLPLAISEFCQNRESDFYCIADVTEQLMYADQWLAIQFIIYLVLSFLLWPIFNKAKANPVINLILVAVIVTTGISLVTENTGIELYASFLCPIFIGLLIKQRRQRRIKVNQN